MKKWTYPSLWLTLGILLLLSIPPLLTRDAALRERTFTILLAIVMASSLNIILGYTGYVSFGHVVFYGLGGYMGVYAIDKWGWPLPLGVLIGGLTSALLAFLLGRAILRLRGAYFALVTIGINEAMRTFVSNFKPFGASTGIELHFSVYKPYGGAAEALWLTYYFVVVISLASILLSYWVRQSKLGLGLMAIREDEDAAEVMGVVTPQYKTIAYVLSAILPGMLGVLFFFKNGTVEPKDAFRLHFSIEAIVMVMLGGQGTVLGPLLGAWGYQRLRGLLLTTDWKIANLAIKDFQLVIAGILLLLIVLFVPAGLVGWLQQKFSKLRRVLI